MSQLKFDFQEMADEIRAFSGIADRFVAPASKNVLSRFAGELETYRNSNNRGEFDWKIEEAVPLRTIATTEYEPGGGGAQDIVGEITSIWSIKKVPTERQNIRARYFKLVGKASTRIRLKRVDDDGQPTDQIAMWRMEIADSKAPGCFFHGQVLGEIAEPPFPSSLPIPRLPVIVATPIAAAEFIFAELFQDSWAPHVAQQVPHIGQWANTQRSRFKKLLKWKLETIESATNGSPWAALKSSQPSEDLFL